ncbi:beta-lactamase/transpeptidase-like protein [Camillea tinctor]|nr:beta-lactamase/transpeptidase-like protein [Camillea tinctor]
MAERIDGVYEEAVASRLLPGVSVIAGDRDDGLLSLDQDVGDLIPRMGKHGIITGFENGSAKLAPKSVPVTLRMLLSHTSGQEYDWMNPVLGQWRAGRNEEPFSGPTVNNKCSIPLVFTPGTSFAYGAGYDWAGKVVEIATKTTLEEFMRARIWAPLGIEQDFSFFPQNKKGMKARMAEFSTLGEKGQPPAVDFLSYDMLGGTTDCIGGGGIYTSAKGYYTFLSALLRWDLGFLTLHPSTNFFGLSWMRGASRR